MMKSQSNYLKVLFLILVFPMVYPTFAQVESRLKKEEVRDMVAICNSFNTRSIKREIWP
jgi:hypothetical protein